MKILNGIKLFSPWSQINGRLIEKIISMEKGHAQNIEKFTDAHNQKVCKMC
jgi:hypothetical protein